MLAAVGLAAFWGLGRTVAEERPELWGGLIDLDGGATTPDRGAAGWPAC